MMPEQLRGEFYKATAHEIPKEEEDRLWEMRQALGVQTTELFECAESKGIQLVAEDNLRVLNGLRLRRRVLRLEVPLDPDLETSIIDGDPYSIGAITQYITVGVHDIYGDDGTVQRSAASVDIATTLVVVYADGQEDKMIILEQSTPAYPVFYPKDESAWRIRGRITHGPSLVAWRDVELDDLSWDHLVHAADRLQADPGESYEGMVFALGQVKAHIDAV
jgi:hypothetical protein